MKNIPPERQMLIMLLLMFGFDQLSKEAARFFGFSIAFNTGISLGFLSGGSAEVMVFLMLVLLTALWYAYAPMWKRHTVLSGVFFGAALSDVFDRIWFGAVRDWLPVPGFSITNNLADWALFLVVGWFAISILRGGQRARN